MTIAVRRFENRDSKAIDRLNGRLEAAQSEHRLYKEDLTLNPAADLSIRPINDSLFVAADGEEIRGGAWLREQYFWVNGARQRVGWMKYPVSESLVDRRHAGVPASMVLQFLRRQPNLMALGMGGHDAPFARLLRGLKWQATTVPFLFRVTRPVRVLRRLAYPRRRPWLRRAMDLAAWTGAGWLAHRLLYATSARGTDSEITVATEARFSPWADGVWYTSRADYQALAWRDAPTLDHLYPASFKNLHRLRIARSGSDIGWVCVQSLPPSDDTAEYFGDLRVGLVTDALSRAVDAMAVLSAGVRHLEELQVDLVITYLTHGAWLHAARRMRFLSGPSTFAFYRSPRAEELLGGRTLETAWHLTRSDGDGPKQ